MGYNNLGNEDQLQLEVADIGQRRWGVRFVKNFVNRLIVHDHTGVNGRGVKLTADSFEEGSIDGSTLLLGVGQWIRQAVTDVLNVNLFRYNNGVIENGEDLELTQDAEYTAVEVQDGVVLYNLTSDAGSHTGECLVSGGEGSISYVGDDLDVACTGGTLSSTESNAVFKILKVVL